MRKSKGVCRHYLCHVYYIDFPFLFQITLAARHGEWLRICLLSQMMPLPSGSPTSKMMMMLYCKNGQPRILGVLSDIDRSFTDHSLVCQLMAEDFPAVADDAIAFRQPSFNDDDDTIL